MCFGEGRFLVGTGVAKAYASANHNQKRLDSIHPRVRAEVDARTAHGWPERRSNTNKP